MRTLPTAGLVAAVLALVPVNGCAGLHPLDEVAFAHLSLEGGAPGSHDLVATFFSVGLGDAILLELPSGRTLLVDAGVGWQVDSILAYLRARRITHLDGMLLTHPHLDHYGGMPAILADVSVGAFFSNGVLVETSRYTTLMAALACQGVPTRVLRRGDRLDLDPDVAIEVLYPDPPGLTLRPDLNGGSVVLRVTHGSRRLLLMGDAEAEEERRLLDLEGATALRADVLKLGHHGTIGSGTPEFLEAVRPRLAIAQGTECLDVPLFFPRPNDGISRTLRRLRVPLLTTGAQGAVQVVSDGATVRWRTAFGRHLARNANRRIS